MDKQHVLFFRNLFAKAFVVGVVIVLLYVILTFALWDTWASLMDKMFMLNEHDTAVIFAEGLFNLRILLVVFVIIPMIALHWTSRKMT
jgi:hypothetical protein